MKHKIHPWGSKCINCGLDTWKIVGGNGDDCTSKLDVYISSLTYHWDGKRWVENSYVVTTTYPYGLAPVKEEGGSYQQDTSAPEPAAPKKEEINWEAYKAFGKGLK